ncbi:MAG: hypothetical protein C5B52_07605 [Bacteroidetes bacterium]|nr:MAG: hypothetical protein C5B52_07605 [Bacteroidota bacterium]
MERDSKFLKSAAHFLVPDVIKASEFYRDKLGFDILGYFGDPPIFVMVSRGNIEIHMSQIKSAIKKASDFQSLPCDLYIWVTEIDALHQELKKNNVEILEGPVQRVYDCIEIVVKDLNGYVLVFGG